MPTNPESEGSRLITLKQIELEHGVSRSALHTYRRSASFPQPVGVAGSTKIQYRADEVAAWFQANPPQQGKRTDLPAKQQKEPAVAKQETTARPAVKDVTTADLVVWLGQQLDEDQREAEEALRRTTTTRRWIGGQWVEDTVQPPEWRRSVWDPARVLREIAAKRRRIALHAGPHECSSYDEISREINSCQWVGEGEACTTLRLEAEPYDERPGFKEEWRP